jgi:putrescine aminotransferase
MTVPDPTAAETFALLRHHASPAMALSARLSGGGAVEVVADGQYVCLSDGRRLLDFGSYAVTLLGHRPPEVVAAVANQLMAMPTGTRTLANPVTARFAADLTAWLNAPGLRRVWAGCTGADVVEAALKLAWAASGRQAVLAVRGAFHGKTAGALTVTEHRPRTLPPPAVPVEHLDPADESAMQRALTRHGSNVAAFIFEPVQGENGACALPLDRVARWCDEARAAGAFILADEIQCGAYRCLEPSLAVASGCNPDAVLLGKALGGGVLPLSAMVAGERLFAPLLKDPFLHTSTFSGHPLACAAGSAALRALAAHRSHAEALTDRLESGLTALRLAFPQLIIDVSGRGLLRAVHLRTPELAGEVLLEVIRRGLVVSPCLTRPTALRLLPSLAATIDDVDSALRIVDAACRHAASRQVPGPTFT